MSIEFSDTRLKWFRFLCLLSIIKANLCGIIILKYLTSQIFVQPNELQKNEISEKLQYLYSCSYQSNWRLRQIGEFPEAKSLMKLNWQFVYLRSYIYKIFNPDTQKYADPRIRIQGGKYQPKTAKKKKFLLLNTNSELLKNERL